MFICIYASVYRYQLAEFCASFLLALFTVNSENSPQVVSAWSIFVEWSSALRQGVKRDWSRCACTLVFFTEAWESSHRYWKYSDKHCQQTRLRFGSNTLCAANEYKPGETLPRKLSKYPL
jgi:hypothetical protein